MVSTNKRSVWWKPRGVGKGRGGVRGRGQVLSQGAIEHLVVVRACTVEVLVHWLSVVQSDSVWRLWCTVDLVWCTQFENCSVGRKVWKM